MNNDLESMLNNNKIRIVKHLELQQENGGVVSLDTCVLNGENNIEHKLVIMSGYDNNNELVTMILEGEYHE